MNPKYVYILLIDHSIEPKERIQDYLDSVKSDRDPFVIDITQVKDYNIHTLGKIIDVLKKHVKIYGTISEFATLSHSGHPGWFGGDFNGSKMPVISTKKILKRFEELQNELGVKVANRIVFHGCNIFSNLNEDDIRFYSDYAKRNNVEIVGATSLQATFITLNIARYVQFSTSGKIIRDEKLDCPYNPFAYIGNDRSWTDYYINHTPCEGALIKKTHELQQKNEELARHKRQEWENKCADFGPKY